MPTRKDCNFIGKETLENMYFPYFESIVNVVKYYKTATLTHILG